MSDLKYEFAEVFGRASIKPQILFAQSCSPEEQGGIDVMVVVLRRKQLVRY